jgi:hypothetical protein
MAIRVPTRGIGLCQPMSQAPELMVRGRDLDPSSLGEAIVVLMIWGVVPLTSYCIVVRFLAVTHWLIGPGPFCFFHVIEP